jgi:hypothetical protein
MATTTNFGWTTPDDTDLVKDGAAAIRTLGSSIDTSLVDLKGGTTGQVLTKASNTDLDFSFTTPAGSPITTEGDLIIGDASGDAVRLPIGSAGTVLTSDGDTADWAALPGGGKVLQVVTATSTTDTSAATTSFVDSGLTATITPTLATSKILVLVMQPFQIIREANQFMGGIRLLRTSTVIAGSTTASSPTTTGIHLNVGTNNTYRDVMNFSILDSPATTSATTYKTQIALANTANFAILQVSNANMVASIILMEIGA